jgi:tRNA pseudouridine38-40 synthase
VTREGDYVWLQISANAYLHHMVRNIVGTLLDVQREANPAAEMTRVLESADRRHAGATAPAAGLYLWRVDYPQIFAIPAPKPQFGLN